MPEATGVAAAEEQASTSDNGDIDRQQTIDAIIADEARRFGGPDESDVFNAFGDPEEDTGDPDEDDDSTEEASADEGAARDSTDDEEAVEEDEDSSTDEAAGTDDRPSFQDVLTHLEEVDPAMAEVVREQRAQGSRMANDVSRLKREMQEVIEEAKAAREQIQQPGQQEKEEPAPGSLRSRLTSQQFEAQRRAFEEMANELGYVKHDTLEQGKIQEAALSYGREAEEQAIEEFGDAYGTRGEDGSITRNPDQESRMLDTVERVEDPQRGLTFHDIFVLTNLDEILAGEREQAIEEAERGQEKQASQRKEKTTRARKAVVQTRTAGRRAQGDPQIYKSGDSLEKVIERAAILSEQEIGMR